MQKLENVGKCQASILHQHVRQNLLILVVAGGSVSYSCLGAPPLTSLNNI